MDKIVKSSQITQDFKPSPDIQDCNGEHNLEPGESIEISIDYFTFTKVFKVLKSRGNMMIGINQNDSLALNYKFEECKSADIFLT